MEEQHFLPPIGERTEEIERIIGKSKALTYLLISFNRPDQYVREPDRSPMRPKPLLFFDAEVLREVRNGVVLLERSHPGMFNEVERRAVEIEKSGILHSSEPGLHEPYFFTKLLIVIGYQIPDEADYLEIEDLLMHRLFLSYRYRVIKEDPTIRDLMRSLVAIGRQVRIEEIPEALRQASIQGLTGVPKEFYFDDPRLDEGLGEL